MFSIVQNAKTSLAKEVVKKRILAISEKDGISPEKIMATFDVYDNKGNFRIFLYNKDNLTTPIREIELGELL
jgi:hypothetical protein